MPALNCKLCVVTLPPGTAKNELLTISPWPLNRGRLMKKARLAIGDRIADIKPHNYSFRRV